MSSSPSKSSLDVSRPSAGRSDARETGEGGQRPVFGIVEPPIGRTSHPLPYSRPVPGAIQSIERAAAVLRLLGSTDRPLGLKEIAAALDLPRPTAHGIVRTLREVGFVEQDLETARYQLGLALRELDSGGWDLHDLRARAMNWADSLAGSTGQAVHLGVVSSGSVRLVHHVFRPDGSPQRIRTGEE